MGTFFHPIEVGASPQGPFAEIDALVDTGTTYTWLPRDLLERLGIVPVFPREFETADGRVIQRHLAEVPVRLDGEMHYTVVVFGDVGTMPLLGAVTLETFGLGVDTLRQRLIRVRGLAIGAKALADVSERLFLEPIERNGLPATSSGNRSFQDPSADRRSMGFRPLRRKA